MGDTTLPLQFGVGDKTGYLYPICYTSPSIQYESQVIDLALSDPLKCDRIIPGG